MGTTGKELLSRLRSLLNEDLNSPFLDEKTAYTYMWDAVTEMVSRTVCLHGSQTITTVADQATYDLSADFLKPFLRDREERLFLKYSDGSNTHTLYWKDYGLMKFDDLTTSVTVPSFWTIIDESSLGSQISSTTTSAGAATGGESALTDTGTDLSVVAAGDTVHNITDGSDGVVTAAVGSTSVKTALFGGTANDWTSGDSYIIQPQGRMAIKLEAPPSTSGHTFTIEYAQRPAPVFHHYGAYRTQQRFDEALIQYAAWLFKYRDLEGDTGDKWFQFFDRKVREYGVQLNHSFNRTRHSVNLKKSQSRSQSAR